MSFNYSIGEGNSLNYKIIAQPGVPPDRQGKALAFRSPALGSALDKVQGKE